MRVNNEIQPAGSQRARFTEKRSAATLPPALPRKARKSDSFLSTFSSFEERGESVPRVLPPSPAPSLRAERQKKRAAREPLHQTFPTSIQTGSPPAFRLRIRRDQATESIPLARIAHSPPTKIPVLPPPPSP